MRELFAAIGGGVAALAVPYGWIVTASAIYCAGVGRPDLFVFPFTQWLDVLPSWRANWWVTLWVVLGAAVPSVIIAAVLCGLVRLGLHRSRRASLYGETGWATPKGMARGGLDLRDKL